MSLAQEQIKKYGFFFISYPNGSVRVAWYPGRVESYRNNYGLGVGVTYQDLKFGTPIRGVINCSPTDRTIVLYDVKGIKSDIIFQKMVNMCWTDVTVYKMNNIF
jgi:hypothetical protein